MLGALLLEPRLLAKVEAILDAGDFYLERHRLIYRAIVALAAEGEPVDERTLEAHLGQAGQLEKVGGIAYLVGLDLALPDLSGIESYARIVRERATRRRLLDACLEIAAACGGERATAELVEEAEQRLLALGTAGDDLEAPADFIETVEALELRAEHRGLLGLSTGFEALDAYTLGLQPGQLVILAGRPGMGKTAFALNVARHVSGSEPVAYVSLEMSRRELEMRLLAAEAEIPFQALRAGRLTDRLWTALFDARLRLSRRRLFILDRASLDLRQVVAAGRRLAAEGLALLVVDYLQLLDASRRHENRQLEVTAISRGLKRLAKELGIPVIALSQLSRAVEERSDHRPRLSDLRESGALEQDADLVCFLYREEVYRRDDPDLRGKAELILAKHRNGETGTVGLGWRGDLMVFGGCGT